MTPWPQVNWPSPHRDSTGAFLHSPLWAFIPSDHLGSHLYSPAQCFDQNIYKVESALQLFSSKEAKCHQVGEKLVIYQPKPFSENKFLIYQILIFILHCCLLPTPCQSFPHLPLLFYTDHSLQGPELKVKRGLDLEVNTWHCLFWHSINGAA